MAIRSHILMAALVAAAATAAACGGGKPTGTTTPAENNDEGGGGGAPAGGQSGDVVPPELADEITRSFERKRASVSRCLSAAIDAKELPRSSRGRMTLNVVIVPGGKAGEVSVAKTSLESPLLTECVVGKVKEIIFPEVTKPYPTSYSYAFEAM
jgi:hypothetical protein